MLPSELECALRFVRTLRGNQGHSVPHCDDEEEDASYVFSGPYREAWTEVFSSSGRTLTRDTFKKRSLEEFEVDIDFSSFPGGSGADVLKLREVLSKDTDAITHCDDQLRDAR